MHYSYSYLINFSSYNFFYRTKVKENTTCYVVVIDWKVRGYKELQILWMNHLIKKHFKKKKTCFLNWLRLQDAFFIMINWIVQQLLLNNTPLMLEGIFPTWKLETEISFYAISLCICGSANWCFERIWIDFKKSLVTCSLIKRQSISVFCDLIAHKITCHLNGRSVVTKPFASC